MKIYKCNLCGNTLIVLNDAGITPVCCGQEMEIINCNNDDSASTEKHVPIYEQDGNKVIVYVGKTLHPSLENHYIDWIEVETDRSSYRRKLKWSDFPTATFHLNDDEKVVNIYAYCNIHGLWKMK